MPRVYGFPECVAKGSGSGGWTLVRVVCAGSSRSGRGRVPSGPVGSRSGRGRVENSVRWGLVVCGAVWRCAVGIGGQGGLWVAPPGIGGQGVLVVGGRGVGGAVSL